jgi:hypothetical protein
VNLPNRIMEYVYIAWPRIWAVKTVYLANMDVPHALGHAMLRAELTSPMRFPGVKPQRNDSVITVQTALRGLPYFDAQQIQNQKLARLNLQTHSVPRPQTGTRGV